MTSTASSGLPQDAVAVNSLIDILFKIELTQEMVLKTMCGGCLQTGHLAVRQRKAARDDGG